MTKPSGPKLLGIHLRGFRAVIFPKAGAFVLASVGATFAFLTGSASTVTEWDLADVAGAERLAEASSAVKFLRDYVRIDTTHSEKPGAELLAERLRSAGLRPEVICPEPERCSVVARLAGEQPGGGLLLLHHIDVVPAGDPSRWKAPPFSADIVGTEVLGRGVVDDKSMGVAFLEGFLAVARKGRPSRTLVFLADADEENLAQRLGVRWLLEHRPELFDGVDYALNEGGVSESPNGKLQYIGLEIGHPSVSKWVLEAPDRARLDQLAKDAAAAPFPFTVTAPTQDFLRRIALVRRATWRERVENLEDALTDPEFRRIFPAGYIALVRPSLEVRSIEPSSDGRFGATLLSLTPPGVDPSPTLSVARELLGRSGVKVVSEVVQPKSEISACPSPLSRTMAEEIHRTLPSVPVGPYLVSYTATTSKYLRAPGITTYGISPFRLTFSQAATIHGVDERMNVRWFVDGVDLMTRLVERFAALPPQPDDRYRSSNTVAR